MPPSTSTPTSSVASTSASSRTPQIVAAAVTAAAALSAGVLFAVISRRNSSGGGGGGGRRTFRSDAALEDPRRAVVEALEAIQRGTCTTCGELVHFLRGPPSSPVSPTSRAAAATERVPPSNAHCLRIPAAVLHYIQESYLPAARRQLAASHGPGQPTAVPTSPLQVEYGLFAEMAAADVSLRALNVERATPFDKDNRGHVNLLQQLWMATGKPATSYNRLGPQWGAIGFQGEDPVTDLRGGGVLALRQLVHFAQAHTSAFREMLAYNARVQGEGRHCWYLLAVVSIQLTTQLLLEQDHPLHVAHLEMLYDTLRLGGAGDAAAKAVSRRAFAVQRGATLGNTSAVDTAAVWEASKTLSSAEAGMFALHHALLLHFKACWERDEPHVMEYNTYMPAKVFASFFSPKWTDTTLAAP